MSTKTSSIPASAFIKMHSTKWISILLITTCLMITWSHAKKDNRLSRYRTLYACEGSSLEITCEEGTHINLIRANFGRFSISVCNDNGNVDWSVDCMSHKSFRVMQESCGSKRSCTLPASSTVFGDPCPGTLKYLEAHYQCMPDVPLWMTTPKQRPEINNSFNPLPQPPNIHDHSTPGPTHHPRIIIPDPVHHPPPTPFVIVPTVRSESDKKPESETTSSKSLENNSENESSESEESKSNNNGVDIPVGKPIENESIEQIPPIIIEQEENSNPKVPVIVSSTIATPKQETNSEFEQNPSSQNNNQDLTVDHCPHNFSRGLYWNWTLAGHVAILPCPGGAKGFAKWSCAYYEGIPMWTPLLPDMSECSSIWVNHLENRIKSGESVVSLAEELAKNCKERILFGSDLFKVTDIVNELVERMEGALIESGDDQERRQHVVKELLMSIQEVVSSVLDDHQRDSWRELPVSEQKGAASSMMHALERVAYLFAESKMQTSNYLRGHDNIFLSIHVRSISSLTDGLTLPSTSEFNDDPVVITSLSNTIHLPQEVLLEQATAYGLVRVVFIMYKRMAQLLHPDYESEQFPVMVLSENGIPNGVNVTRVINSEIVGVMINKERYTPLKEPVTITLKHTHQNIEGSKERLSNAKCVFWDIDRRDWSTQGCITLASNESHTTCQCNHLTNFAILMDVTDVQLSSVNEFALRLITYFGCIISIVCLSLTLITLISFKSLKSDRSAIHTNLCLCLLIAEMLFVSGVTQTQSKILCGFIAAGLHYFFLSAFFWMFLEGFQLYVLLVEVFDHEKSRLKWYYILGYGFPGIVVLISTAIDPLSYGTSKHCWLRTDNYFIWCFVGPVIAILLANLIFLSIALTTMCKHVQLTNKNKEQNKLSNLRSWLKGSLALVFLLGLTWSFGLLYLSNETIAMAYLFTLTNSFQGMFIFIFHCLMNEKVRFEYMHLLARLNLMPVCMKENESKSHSSRDHQMRHQNSLQNLNIDHHHRRSSLFINTSNTSSAKESTSTTNTTINSNVNVEPLIPGCVQHDGNTPNIRRSIQRYYLTDDTSSDYGCKRLELNHHNPYAKQVRDLYSLHSHHFINYPPNFIEHIYECIDEDPYIAKLINPAAHRQIDGQHLRSLSNSSKTSDSRPLIGVSSARSNHFLNVNPISQGHNLPAIVRDNTAMKSTIICGQQHQHPANTMAVLNGDEVVCCALNDHQLCDHPLINGQSRAGHIFVNNFNCLQSNNCNNNRISSEI